MLHTSLDLLSNSSDTERVRLWPLEESAITANDIRHAVLGRSVKFCPTVSQAPFAECLESYLQTQKQSDCLVSRDPSDKRLQQGLLRLL